MSQAQSFKQVLIQRLDARAAHYNKAIRTTRLSAKETRINRTQAEICSKISAYLAMWYPEIETEADLVDFCAKHCLHTWKRAYGDMVESWKLWSGKSKNLSGPGLIRKATGLSICE